MIWRKILHDFNRKRLLFYVCIALGIVIFWATQSSLRLFRDNSYFAVFLTNGQVYFGHIQKNNSNTIELKDVYYLRTNTNLNVEEAAKNTGESNLNLSLVKLGKEIHGPKNEMMINKQQVLFWEELREDSDFVKTIKSYK